MNGKICNTPVTESYLAKCLRKALGPRAVLQAVRGEQIALGQGFVSTILRVHLTWEKPENLPKTLIVKIPIVDTITDALNKMQVEDPNKTVDWNVTQFVTTFHNTECQLYTLFQNYSPVPVPICYVATTGTGVEPGMLVMEDLSPRSSVIPCMIKGLSLAQIVNATTEMAKLHAWSLTTSIDWRSYVKDAEHLRAVYQPMLVAMHYGYHMIKDQYPDHFGSIDPKRLTAYLTFDRMLDSASDHRCFMDDVLTHGDCWANNIMYEEGPNGTIGDEVTAFVDWQLAARGCPMADLSRIMSWSVSPEIRHNHIDEIIAHYHRILKSIAGDKVTATIHQMRQWYDRQFAYNVLWVLTGLNVFAEKFAKGEGEENRKERVSFVERMKVNYEDAVAIVQNDKHKFSLYDSVEYREK